MRSGGVAAAPVVRVRHRLLPHPRSVVRGQGLSDLRRAADRRRCRVPRRPRGCGRLNDPGGVGRCRCRTLRVRSGDTDPKSVGDVSGPDAIPLERRTGDRRAALSIATASARRAAQPTVGVVERPCSAPGSVRRGQDGSLDRSARDRRLARRLRRRLRLRRAAGRDECGDRKDSENHECSSCRHTTASRACAVHF